MSRRNSTEGESLQAWYVNELRKDLKKPLYTCVKSNYVRRRIMDASWEESENIDRLITLERFILNGPHSFAEGMFYHKLKSEYSKEWMMIYKELKPKELESILASEAKDQEIEQRLDKEEENLNHQRLEFLKLDWKKAGGRL